MSTAYDTDPYAWAHEQAALLRAGLVTELDLAHLAEEIEDMAGSHRRALVHRLEVLLVHLLKLWLAHAHQPDTYVRTQRNWRATSATQRLHLADLLRRHPSLRREVPAALQLAYAAAATTAPVAVGVRETLVPDACPWTVDQILNAAFWPEEVSDAK